MAYVHEGYPMMSKVTAMACTATGIVGAFLAVNSDPLEASFHAMKAMEIAGGIHFKINGNTLIVSYKE